MEKVDQHSCVEDELCDNDDKSCSPGTNKQPHYLEEIEKRWGKRKLDTSSEIATDTGSFKIPALPRCPSPTAVASSFTSSPYFSAPKSVSSSSPQLPPQDSEHTAILPHKSVTAYPLFKPVVYPFEFFQQRLCATFQNEASDRQDNLPSDLWTVAMNLNTDSLADALEHMAGISTGYTVERLRSYAKTAIENARRHNSEKNEHGITDEEYATVWVFTGLVPITDGSVECGTCPEPLAHALNRYWMNPSLSVETLMPVLPYSYLLYKCLAKMSKCSAVKRTIIYKGFVIPDNSGCNSLLSHIKNPNRFTTSQEPLRLFGFTSFSSSLSEVLNALDGIAVPKNRMILEVHSTEAFNIAPFSQQGGSFSEEVIIAPTAIITFPFPDPEIRHRCYNNTDYLRVVGVMSTRM